MCFHISKKYTPYMRPPSIVQLHNNHRDEWQTMAVQPFDEIHLIVSFAFWASTFFYYSHVADHTTAQNKRIITREKKKTVLKSFE